MEQIRKGNASPRRSVPAVAATAAALALLGVLAFLAHSSDLETYRDQAGHDQEDVQLSSDSQRQLMAASEGHRQNLRDPQSITFKDQVETARKRCPRRIFGCSVQRQSVQKLFPKWYEKYGESGYISLGSSNPARRRETPNIFRLIDRFDIDDEDLLYGNFMQAENCISGGVINFPGQQLYFNPEAFDQFFFTPKAKGEGSGKLYHPDEALEDGILYDSLPPAENMHVMGPHEDTDRSTRVHLGLFQLAFSTKDDDLQRIIDPQRKPVGTGKYFLGYFNSHYVELRERAIGFLADSFYDAENPEQTQIHVGPHCQGYVPPSKESDGYRRFCAVAPEDSEHYKKIHIVDGDGQSSSSILTNQNLFSNYRFILAFENTYRDGYITEKLLNVFLSGAIPIYWGSQDVFNIFNAKAFIYYNDTHPEETMKIIRKLENDKDMYEAMLKQPILSNGNETINKFFSMTPDIGNGALRRKILDKLGFDPDDC